MFENILKARLKICEYASLCYWDGIVHNFLYFLCTQLTKFVFFSHAFFVDETWFLTKEFVPSNICRINFHGRSNVCLMAGNPDTVTQSES